MNKPIALDFLDAGLLRELATADAALVHAEELVRQREAALAEAREWRDRLAEAIKVLTGKAVDA